MTNTLLTYKARLFVAQNLREIVVQFGRCLDYFPAPSVLLPSRIYCSGKVVFRKSVRRTVGSQDPAYALIQTTRA